jgi:hypothetical protein
LFPRIHPLFDISRMTRSYTKYVDNMSAERKLQISVVMSYLCEEHEYLYQPVVDEAILGTIVVGLGLRTAW